MMLLGDLLFARFFSCLQWARLLDNQCDLNGELREALPLPPPPSKEGDNRTHHTQLCR